MDRDKQPLTAQEKIEMDMLAEAELGKLQRQYRIMEGDRRAFSEETQTKLGKQRRMISVLRKEQSEMITDLKVATSDANKRRDQRATVQLNRMLDEHETYSDLIKKEKTNLNEVNQEIQKLEKRVNEIRCKGITDATFEEKVRSAEKNVRVLENKLDNEIKRFCSILEENRRLREKIEHLLKERAHFNFVCESMGEKLNQDKKLILDLIEQSTVAYDQREEWCSKLHALRLRSRNDLLLHAEEMKDLQRQLNHDTKLYDFLGIKGQKRIMRDLEEYELNKLKDEKELLLKQQERYEEMLKEIKELVNEDEVSRLGSQYIKQEEENFALFNYVNELNHEIEILNADIERLQENLEVQKEQYHIKMRQQQETIQSLQEDLQRSTEETTKTECDFKDTERNLENLLNGVRRMFDLIGCDYTPVLQLLGTDAAINENNVMIYLGVLERKISEITANMFLKEKNVFKMSIAWVVSISSITAYFTEPRIIRKAENALASGHVSKLEFDDELGCIRGDVQASMKNKVYRVDRFF
ncbi:hypothetical protein FQA39_LY15836 [Lamprigera yunnana]|nr:hypothetical protein FQA39_LY15836 [Lamprigera yunnana]